MDIQELAMGLAQQRTQEQAAVQVQRMALEEIKGQSAALAKLLESVEFISDPGLGNSVNLFG
jgi:transcriptional regulator with GAF, ATPase, and Fis domain